MTFSGAAKSLTIGGDIDGLSMSVMSRWPSPLLMASADGWESVYQEI